MGAGPTGSYIAGRLASWGHNVLVLEKQECIGKASCCTGIVGKECLQSFPFGKEAVLRESRSAKLFAPSGEHLGVRKDTTQAYILDRAVFDAEIARSAQGQGAQYLMGSQVTGISVGTGLVSVESKSQGRPLDFGGKTVVIASGFGSKLPLELGLRGNGDFVMGAQAEVEAMGLDEVEVYFGSHVAPGFFAWLVPTSQGRALAGLLSRHHTGSYLKRFLHDVASRGKIASPEVRIRYGGIPLEPLPRTSGERVIVVGDAAGQVKPTTGGGIYYGLLCAHIAADTLHQALCANDFSTKALSSYDRKWRGMLSQELRIGRWARWVFEKLNDRQIEYLFQRARSRHIPESLLNAADFSFDSHGRLIVRGARYVGLVGAMSLLWLCVHRQ